VARFTGTVWGLEERASAVEPLGGKRRLGECFQAIRRRRRQRIRHDRQDPCARPSTQRRCSKKDGEDQAIGRSKGGLSTKIHATVDALRHPTGFVLTAGQACDLEGADVLLPMIKAQTVLADRNRKDPRQYDKELYRSRHLIENFFRKLKQFRAISTRYDKTARNFLAAVYLAALAIWLN